MWNRLVSWFDNEIHPDRVKIIRRYLRRLIIAIGLINLTLAIGVIGFIAFEKYSFWDAFYMTIITVSTVGFNEVQPLTKAGRIFVSFLIVTNLGIFMYAISSVASFFLEGNFRKMVSDLKVGRKIDAMKGHIIICGLGRYGQNVAEHLSSQGLKTVIVESNHETVKDTREKSKQLIIEGDATDENILKEAGIATARALITTLPVDAENVYVALTARQLNPNIKIISRVRVASSKKNLLLAGADHVLVPESIGGFYMAALITKPDIIGVFTDLSSMGDHQFHMAEIILDPMPERLKGKSIDDIGLQAKTGVNIIGLKTLDGQYVVNPKTNKPLQEGTALLVIGNEEQIALFHELTYEFKLIE